MERELLYWIPFLRWFAARFAVPPDRIAAASRPGAECWYEDVCGTYSASAAEPAGPALAPALLEEICRDYWHERGPLVHVLDRLVYARVASPGPAARETVVFWPSAESDVTLETAPADITVIDPNDRDDAGAITAAVARASMLVGPWSGRLVLGPMLGVPTVALTDGSSASPDLDLAHRAARALGSPLLFVDVSQVDAVARLAARVTG